MSLREVFNLLYAIKKIDNCFVSGLQAKRAAPAFSKCFAARPFFAHVK
jgi:hypothetical protein